MTGVWKEDNGKINLTHEIYNKAPREMNSLSCEPSA